MRVNTLSRAVAAAAVLSFASGAMVWQRPKVALPMVLSAQVPLYPQTARTANVQGIVHIRVETDGQRVTSAQAEDGNQLLSAPAEKNVKTWQFSLHKPTTFTVTYKYRLVDDIEASQNNPRVLLKLPTEVEVDALRWPGTVDTP
jgi:outer membrane biosynthesis protein TonB